MDSTQQAPAAVARRSFEVLVSALQEATCVFVARVWSAQRAEPAGTAGAGGPGDDPPAPNRDYFTGDQ